MANPQKTINTVNEYLETLTSDQREHLERIRQLVIAASPELEEGLTYSTPAYRVNGKLVVGLAAAKTHTGFYVMSEAIMEQFKGKLTDDYELAKTSFKVPLAKLPSASLIKQLVLARIDENNVKSAKVSVKNKSAVKRS